MSKHPRIPQFNPAKSKRHIEQTASPVPPSAPATEFDLADLSRFDPEKIIAKSSSDPFAMFMLALALVYNDHKGLFIFSELLRTKRIPPDRELSAHAGQFTGLDMQIYRLRIGLFRELFQLIAKFKDQATGPEMQRILTRISPQARTYWRGLVSVALDQGGEPDSSFKTTLVKIRGTIAFHYDQPKKLVEGYRKHFFEVAPHPANRHAYASLGNNMERTRFYFVDAAVSGSLTLLQDKRFLKRIVQVSNAANWAIRFIVDEYIRPAQRDEPTDVEAL